MLYSRSSGELVLFVVRCGDDGIVGFAGSRSITDEGLQFSSILLLPRSDFR